MGFRWKRSTLSVLAVTMAASVGLMGCSGRGAENTNDSATAPVTAENVYKEKYDPEVTISTVWGIDPAVTFKNGETIENSVATKWAKEQFGINIDSLWSVTDTNGAFATKVRLSMSSRQDMPDILTIGADQTQLVQDLIESGIYGEVGELFDKYASDTWKEAMNIDPTVWNAYTRDGKKMGIPVLDYAYNNDYLLWIRQDWLDKLNLKAPTTIDELEAVMEAFKNNNPSGLSPDKVTPLSIGIKNSMNTWMADPSWIFGAYGTLPQQWNIGEDGKLEYGSVHPGMKQGLQKLSEWFDKGYIPQEVALWDENKTAEPAVAGTAGIIPGPYWMSGWPLVDTVKNDPEAVWKPYPIPTGENGTAMRHGTHFSNGVTLIKKDMEHPEAFFTYQNYLFDHFADPAAGSEHDFGLFEGYDYQLDADGKQVRYDEIEGGYVNVLRYLLVRDGARIPDAQMKALLNLADGKEAETRLEREVKANYGLETPQAAKVLMSQEDISYKDMFTGPPTETMKSKLDYLNKIENQTFNEIIYGNKPVDAFDTFVETWKTGGGDQITQEVNEWYDSVK
ncbi:extracellular solute-binding protein [Paenibacillus sp. PDC88]|uniref:extracellular solute-binding protein n=1 Tax=Paenibacillus sp. PDC88 TaxID=1884375 RepID=UPI000899E650|nr:extracellular solute-binding protein [Paenibacillus sp. PDC88]SDW18948.1 carbohydrate ABC transporter substrate-binding protein, CUT1 family [Paenibacillus sp. PDC88]